MSTKTEYTSNFLSEPILKALSEATSHEHSPCKESIQEHINLLDGDDLWDMLNQIKALKAVTTALENEAEGFIKTWSNSFQIETPTQIESMALLNHIKKG